MAPDKVPLPLCVHRIEVAYCEVAVLTVTDAAWHTAISDPAFTMAWRLMVSTIASLIETHGAAGVTVRVRVTEPFSLSAALGVYTGFRVAELLKEPVPEVDHRSDKALVEVAPLRV